MSEQFSPAEVSRTQANARLARMCEATGCRSQYELAEVLCVRQSFISDAKRRGALPPRWLAALLRSHGVNPEWILSGTGPKFLAPGERSADARAAEPFPPVRAVDATIVRMILRCFPSGDLLGELRRRKECGDEPLCQ